VHARTYSRTLPRPSRRTSTATSVRRSSGRRPTGSTRRSAGDRCRPLSRVAVRMRGAGHPHRVTRP
jgi:hypothetical protein